MKLGTRLAPALLLLSLAACGEEEAPRSPAVADTAGSAETPMGSMQDMPGMGMAASVAMMDEMGAHLRGMDGAGADSLAAMMPAHRQRLANLIAQMNREMREMGMSADPAWDATVDSLRTDLRTMPEMTAAEMPAMMEPHRARVDRLMAMHRAMMQRMSM